MNAPAPSQLVELAVDGMTCAACAARIEKNLNRIEGVSASVNFASEKASVRFQPEKLDVARIIESIRAAGYDAQVQAKAQLRDHSAENRTAWRRFLLAAVFTLPLLIEMGAMLGGRHEPLIPLWLQFALATPVQFVSGARFYRGAWSSLRGGGANMDVLVALGTTMAYALSTVVVLLGLPQHVYFEAGSAVITLVLLGKFLEARAKARTSAALEALIRLQPETAWVEQGGSLAEVPIERVRRGDVFVVRPGDSVPLDGDVIAGESSVNEAMLTGESLPVSKRTGSKVYAATLNSVGMLKCRATGIGSDTMLAGIIRLVDQAQGSKAPVQQLADRVAAVFVPAVVAVAILTFAGWLAYGAGLDHALIAAVAVLVIACPCALGLATPTALMVGIGRGAKAGILIRNAVALENAQRITVVLLDKTGTLTEGQPSVVATAPAAGVSEVELLQVAAGLEQGSEHALARAICDYASQKGVAGAAPDGFAAVSGKGVAAMLSGKPARLGSPAYVAELGIVIDQALLDRYHDAGNTVVAVALEGRLLGYIALADRLRPSSARAVARLKAAGLRVIMLSGDNAATAAAIAAQCGIGEVIAGVLPQDKAAKVEALKQQGEVTGMAGDGINDAPALAAADVSFAIAAGSGIAIEAADVTLMRDDLNAVADALDLSRRTLSKIRQNLFFAFGYNVLGIPLAALGMLSPVIAGAAMALSSVSVISNSLLLNNWKPK